ncbi:FHA domain-containing protein [Demequina soli]|uniref:FHA domain-containing protein n=1 Tax=Demequina soli TaxID=1638987 RepID=UPI0007864EB6|nr:FHA domain-containing protein [Demequina soli]
MTAGVLAETMSEAAPAGTAALGLTAALVGAFLVSVVWMGLALGALYRRVGARGALAWIPVVRYAVMAHLTQSSVAGTVVARVVTAAGLVTWGCGVYLASSSTIALAGLGVAIVAGATAWMMWIVQTRRFGLDHSLPTGLTVVAAVAPGLWAAIVGWGSLVRPVSGTLPVRAPAVDDAPVAEVAEVEPVAVAVAAAPFAPVAAPAVEPVEAFAEPAAEAVAEPVTQPVTPPVTPPEVSVWGIAPAAGLWSNPEPVEPPVDQMYPVEPFTGSDGYPEDETLVPARPAPPEPDATAPVEPEPAPEPEADASAPVDEPALRTSPYATLAPRDLDDEPDGSARLSPYAELAPREPARLAEDAAWEAAMATPAPGTEVPAVDPEPAPEVAPAFLDIAAVEVEPEPEPLDEAPEPEPEPTLPPVHVEPTPTAPLSPYLRGGAAAPPAAPAGVPTFAMPAAFAAVPELEPEPVPEASVVAPAPAPVPAPAATTAPPVDPAPPTIEHHIVAPPPRTLPAPETGPDGAAEPTTVPIPAVAAPAEDDRTQVSARVREAWELVTSEGGTYRFDSTTVLLGRLGGLPPIDGTRRLDLADSTRTVSKSHARLRLERGGWWVEDLGSTNGTYLVDPEGREAQVPEGVPTPVAGRLILGDVEVQIRRRGGAA